MATWGDVGNARQSSPVASNVEDLLRELAQDGDLEAAIQLDLLALDGRVRNGDVRHCEAFAEALDAIARAMETTMLDSDLSEESRRTGWDHSMRQTFLTYAWAYLVGLDDRQTYGYAGVVSHLVPKGSWDSVSPEWASGHQDGFTGSGFMPPRDDDPDGDRSGRKAHLLANMSLGHYYGILGGIPADHWARSETSTTDNEVNSLGVDIGQQLRGGSVLPGNLGALIKAKLCTEGRCAAGTVTSQLVDKLRYGWITGEATRSHKEVDTKHDPTATPPNSRREYTRNEKVTVTARVQLLPDSSSATFGRADEGNWKVTSVLTETGQPERRQEGYGPVTRVTGEFVVAGPGAGSYRMVIDGVASESAVDPNPSSYIFTAGGDDRSLCADQSLSGSDSRKKSETKVTTVGDPQNWGEMLRGASVHHDVTETETVEWQWSWKFTFTAAPPPEHAALCGRRYLYEEITNGAAAFISRVTQELMPVVVDLTSLGRNDQAEALNLAYVESYSALGDLFSPFGPLSSSIEDACQRLDILWLEGGEHGGEIDYNDLLEKYKANVEDWNRDRESLIDYLAAGAEAVADNVRPHDSVAAGKFDDLAARLRRDGFESFVE